ncbi:MAG TPA: peptide ABC transporter substrate-binding protein [Gemmatimonadaceae bacterium]|nr:peptide ABC transporter substrate-binding protein [Gemmatimonadaceae bacterium]
MLPLLLALACAPSPRPRDVIVFASGTDLESGNPLVTVHSLSRQVQRFALFTTLARYDSALAPVPYAARAWSWSPDRRTLTFTLATGLAWHDGAPTTARDVAFTLLAARDPVTGYPRAGDLAAIDTVTARNDSMADVRFSGPQSAFPLVLCELPIVPEHLLASTPRGDMRRAAFNVAPVGNGPFRFVSRAPGQRWTFARNPDFPAALGGPPAVSELVVAVVDEPTTKFAGLASGDLDFAGIAPTMAALAARDPQIRVRDYPVFLSVALVFNAHRAPFDDVRVRRAIDLSLDRQRIVSAALAGFARPASGPVAPENPLADAASPHQDTRAADSLLTAAGWTRGADGALTRGGSPFTVSLLTVGAGDHALEQLIQADLGARGIRVDIRDMELGAFLTAARAHPPAFDFLVTGITTDVSLAYLGAMYDSRQRGGALDYGDFHTPALDAALARARTASGDEARTAWRSVQAELAREEPAVWIYHARGLQGVAKRMEGVRFDLRGELASLSEWRVADAAR